MPNNRQDVGLAHHQLLCAIDFDLGSCIFSIKDTIARLNDHLFIFCAVAHGNHFTLQRFLFCTVGDNNATCSCLFSFCWFNKNTIT